MDIIGQFPYEQEVVTSVRHDTRIIVEQRAFDRFLNADGTNVFMLLGYDYASSLSNQAAGLTVTSTDDALQFSAKGIPNTLPAAREARMRIRENLVQGVIPGYRTFKSRTRELPSGGELTVIEDAMLCEINLVGRAVAGINLRVKI